MSLYNAKCRAIRQTLISEENSEKLTKFLQEQGVENLPYSKLAEYIITNGDCGLEVDLETPLREAFVKYVDEHTTAKLNDIWDIVCEWCGEDFLMDSWDDIYDAHFKAWDIYDNVLYVVESECNGRKWEASHSFDLCTDYKTAKIYFEQAKGDGENSMDAISDNWSVECDTKYHWMAQDNYYESWVEVTIYKKPIM